MVYEAIALRDRALTARARSLPSDHPQLAAHLRIIDIFGPSTIQPVVAASRLPGPLKDQVRDVLVSLGDDPTARTTLAHGFIQGFARVDDAAYDVDDLLPAIHRIRDDAQGEPLRALVALGSASVRP